MAGIGDAHRLEVLASDVHSSLEFHKTAYTNCVRINNELHCVMEEKGKLQQEQNAVGQLVTEKDKLIAELKTRNEKQAAEIESLKEQLEVRESSHVLLALQRSDLPSSQSGRVCTRSKHKRTRESDGNGEVADEHEFMDNPDHGLSSELENAKKELSDIHSKLIKGFKDIGNTGGRNVSIKNIGQLSDKPFQQACLHKLPPEEASEKASELYNFWQKQLLNPDWKLSKTSMVEGIPKKIEVHDVDLKELRDEWGGEVYNAVVNCLVEIEECGRLMDTTIIPEIWNYKEDRKATRSECVEYIFSQVKRLGGAKGRMTRGRGY